MYHYFRMENVMVVRLCLRTVNSKSATLAIIFAVAALLFLPSVSMATSAPTNVMQRVSGSVTLSSFSWTSSSLIVSSFTLPGSSSYCIQATSATVNDQPDWTKLLWGTKRSSVLNAGTTWYNWPALTSPGIYWWRIWAESAGVASSTITVLSAGGPAAFAYKTDVDPRGIDVSSGLGVDFGEGNGVFGGLALGDYDNNGTLDLAVAGYTGSQTICRVYKGNGDGTFNQAFVEPITGWGSDNGSINWGDYNNDGSLDLLVNGNGSDGPVHLYVFKNNGDGTFNSTPIEPKPGWGLHYGNAQWGDYNNDGYLDIVTEGQDYPAYQNRFYLFTNLGNGSFNPVPIDPDPSDASGYSTAGFFDYNNDGYLDICMTGTGSWDNRIYKNNGDGTFTNSGNDVPWPYGGGYTYGDYDNDGNVDVCLPDGIWQNNGNGTFSGGVQFGGNEGTPALADMNNDGKLDVVVVGSYQGNFLKLIANNGGSNFTATDLSPATTGQNFSYIVLGDLDGDGDADIVVAGQKNDGSNARFLSVYKNKNYEMGNTNTAPQPPAGLTALFSYNVNSASITLCWTPAQYDVGHSSYSIYYNVEMATAPTTLTGSNMRVSGANGYKIPWDYPSDQGNYIRPAVKQRAGLSQITQGSSYQVPYGNLQANATYYFRVQTIDAGLMRSTWSAERSICAAAPLPPNTPSGLMQCLVGGATVSSYGWVGKAGDVIFSSFTLTDPNGSSPVKYRIQITSVTAAGIAPVWNQGIAVDYTSGWLPQGATTYYWPGLPVGLYWWQVYCINGSSVASSVATTLADGNNPVLSYKTNFDPTGIDLVPGLGVNSGFVSLGDFDNNGTLDMAVIGYTGSSYISKVYKNNGDGSFNQIAVAPSNSVGVNGSAAWGDYNNDGDLDLAVSGYDGGSPRLRIYKNSGLGTFNSSLDLISGGGLGSSGDQGVIAWGDFNNDGYLDLAGAGTDGSAERFYVFMNNGNGSFNTTPVQPDPGWGVDNWWGGICTVDCNNDGNLDIAVAGTSDGFAGYARIYKGNGNGKFNSAFTTPDAGYNGGDQGYASMTFGDYNLDGNLDAAVGGVAGFRVDKGNGDATFTDTTLQPDGAGWFGSADGGAVIAWADINNDGKPDMVIGGLQNGNGGKFRLELNNGNGTFTSSDIQPGWNSFCNVALGDLDNDGDADAVVSNQNGNDSGHYYLKAFFNKTHEMGIATNAPVPPGSLTYQSSYAITGSTVMITWPAAQYDATASSRTLSFQVEISTAQTTLASNKKLISAPSSAGAFINTWASEGDDYGTFYRPAAKVWGTDPSPKFGIQLNLSTATIQGGTSYYYRIQTIDGSLLRSTWSVEGTLYMPMGTAPAAITNLTALKGNSGGELKLNWTSPGADGTANNIYGGVFKIRYSTYTIASAGFWTDAASNWTDPLNKYQITIPTNSTPSTTQSTTLVGLTPGGTYYVRAWVRDEVGVDSTSWNGNWSALSNAATAYAMTATTPQVISDLVATNNAALGAVNLAWTAPGGNGQTGDLNAGSAFKIKYSTVNVITTDNFTTMQSTMAIQSITISTVATAMSRQSYNVGGLTNGKKYWFAIETENSQAAWSTWYSSATGDGHTTYSILASTICSYTNHAPTISSLEQLNGSMVSMTSFTWINSGAIISSFTIIDTDLGQQVRFNIQITSITTNDAADWTSIFASTRSALTSQGTLNYTWPALNPNVYYWWRAWAEDQFGLTSATSTALVSDGAAVIAYKTPYDPHFIEPTPGWGVGYWGGGTAWGDFNGDGNQDIAVTGCGFWGGNDYLRVYLNNGDGTFSSSYIEPQIGVGFRSGAVAWGDFDNDGDLDLAATGSVDGDVTGILRVYRNNGNGASFSTTYTDAPGWGGFYSSVAWGDYDNDGNLDVAVTGTLDGTAANGRFRIYHNTGNGTFDTNYLQPTANWGVTYSNTTPRIGWADYENDGDLDIAVCGTDISSTNVLRVYKNNGDGTFASSPALLVNDVIDFTWSDYDNDGYLDIIGVTATGRDVRVFPNNRNGTLNASPVMILPGLNVDFYALCAGDYDNDGNVDVVVTGHDLTSDNGCLRQYRSLGNGTFDQKPTNLLPGWGPRVSGSLALSDYNNDGALDIAVTGCYDTGWTPTWFRIFQNMEAQLGNANTAPVPPTISTATFSYSATRSTFTVAWAPGYYDVGHSSNSVYYNVEVATYPTTLQSDNKRIVNSNKFVQTWDFGSPNLGSYIRPAVSTSWAGVKGTQMVGYTIAPSTNNYLLNATTFYFRVQTIDSGLMRSTWSAEYSCLASSFVASPSAGIMIVAGATASNRNDSAGTALTAMFAQGVPAGDLLVAAVAYEGNGAITVADGKGQTWQPAVTRYDSGNTTTWAIYYIYNTQALSSTAEKTVTLTTVSGTTYRYMVITEFSGAQASSDPLDKTTSGNRSFSTGANGIFTDASPTPSVNGELLFCSLMQDSNTHVPQTAGTDFTMVTNGIVPNDSISSNYHLHTEYYVQPTAAAHLGTYTCSGSDADTYAIAMATFKPATAGDTTPPAAITNISAVTGLSGGSINLTWTAPGDDGISGAISGGAFKIRYSSYTPTSWTDAASNWTDYLNKYQITLSTNATPGAWQARTLTGLTEGVTYYIRAWSRDEVGVDSTSWNGNWSTLSNGATAWATVSPKPSCITDLVATTNVAANGITLTWTAPGDNGQTGSLTAGSVFKIEYSTVNVINGADFALLPSTMVIQSVTISTTTTAMSRQSYTLPSLSNNTKYWCAIKTCNAEGGWSVWQSSADVAAYNMLAATVCVNGPNSPPNAPANLVQYDGSFVNLSSFTWTNSSTIISSFTLTDPDAGQQVKYRLQITTVSSNGLAIWTNGYFIDYTSPLLNQGTTTYYWPTLTAGKFYWWRVWAIDAANATSSTSTVLSSGGPAVVAWNTPFDPKYREPMPGDGIGGGGSSLAWGDFDGDGYQDLAILGNSNSSGDITKVFPGKSDGTFNAAVTLPSGQTFSSGGVAWGDFNNDGLLDLAIAGKNSTTGNGSVRVYRNTGGAFSATFVSPETVGYSFSNLAWGDYDNDGCLDLVVAGWTDSYAIVSRVYHNNGNAGFTVAYNNNFGVASTDVGSVPPRFSGWMLKMMAIWISRWPATRAAPTVCQYTATRTVPLRSARPRSSNTTLSPPPPGAILTTTVLWISRALTLIPG